MLWKTSQKKEPDNTNCIYKKEKQADGSKNENHDYKICFQTYLKKSYYLKRTSPNYYLNDGSFI